MPRRPASPNCAPCGVEKMLRENPSMKGKHFSNPIVTNALTHGLSIVGDMFVDDGDHVILPDMLWGNYNLTFGTCNGGIIKKHPTFTAAGGYDVEAFKADPEERPPTEKGKAVVLLNFPNNPSGYTPTVAEGDALVAAILEVAEAGCNIVAVTDDAYFGLFYEDTPEGIPVRQAGQPASAHPGGQARRRHQGGVRLGLPHRFHHLRRRPQSTPTPQVLTALEKKTMGIIRAKISNCPHPSQTFVIEALRLPTSWPRRKRSSRS